MSEIQSLPKLTAAEFQAEYEYACIMDAEMISAIVWERDDEAVHTSDTVNEVRRIKLLAKVMEDIGLPTDPAAYTLGFVNELRAALTRQRDTADAGQRELFGDGGE